MPAKPQHYAIHEAGHAILQWMVGWQSLLMHIHFRRVKEGVTDGGMKADPPQLDTLRNARSRLVVLYGGICATDLYFPSDNVDHFYKDWMDILAVVNVYVKRTKGVDWNPADRYELRDLESKEFLSEARDKTREIIADQRVRAAVESTSRLLLEADGDEDGWCHVMKHDIVEVCEETCGTTFVDTNPWHDWIHGRDRNTEAND